MKKILYTVLFTWCILASLSAQRPNSDVWQDAGNIKVAQPTGIGDEHFIKSGQDITYTIFFQNNGPDTIYNLRVIDTLSNFLDPTSLRLEGSSHPFALQVLADNILRFSFANIRLPGSSDNEPAARGWLKFTISPKEKLPALTFITNQATIYFDFAPIVQTNLVYHTISDNLTNTGSRYRPAFSVGVFPNPLGDQAVFDLSGAAFRSGELFVYNAMGQLVRRQIFAERNFEFQREHLPAGAYFYQIYLDELPAGNGKFLVR